MCIDIAVDDNLGVAELWLTISEKGNKETMETVRKLCVQYSAQNYRVAVFLSGSKSLLGGTTALLLGNR